jgi:hypothetical protein
MGLGGGNRYAAMTLARADHNAVVRCGLESAGKFSGGIFLRARLPASEVKIAAWTYSQRLKNHRA